MTEMEHTEKSIIVVVKGGDHLAFCMLHHMKCGFCWAFHLLTSLFFWKPPLVRRIQIRPSAAPLFPNPADHPLYASCLNPQIATANHAERSWTPPTLHTFTLALASLLLPTIRAPANYKFPLATCIILATTSPISSIHKPSIKVSIKIF